MDQTTLHSLSFQEISCKCYLKVITWNSSKCLVTFLCSTMILQLHCPLCLWPRWLFAGTQLTARHSVWSSSKSCSLLLLPVDAHTSILPSVVHILQLVAPIVASFYLCVHLCGLIIQTCTPPSLYLGATCRPILFPILALMLRWFLCANNPFKGICTDRWKCKRIISLVTQFPQGWQFIFYEHTASPPPWEIPVCPLQGCEPKILVWLTQECLSPIFSALAKYFAHLQFGSS